MILLEGCEIDMNKELQLWNPSIGYTWLALVVDFIELSFLVWLCLYSLLVMYITFLPVLLGK